MRRDESLVAVFYRTSTGNEPVREWIKEQPRADRISIGVDIWKVQSEWPIGMPHVRPLGGGLYEIRSRLRSGIGRVIFIIAGNNLVLLHGFVKKTQKTPPGDLLLARQRKRNYEQT